MNKPRVKAADADVKTISEPETLVGRPGGISREQVVELTSKLIAIPSVNGEEGCLGEYLRELFQILGLQVVTQEVAPGRFNVLGIWPPIEEIAVATAGLLLHAHYDTAAPYDMEEPFSGAVRGGYIWGRGTVDQKGGLAAAIMAVATVKSLGFKPSKPVVVAAVVDEEAEHRGSSRLVQSGLKADMAIVTEPSSLRIVPGCKGTVPLKIEVEGRAAHGCRPWLGINAVARALPILKRLFELTYPEVDLGPELGRIRGSLNVGLIQGGVAYNMVPASCTIWLDRRTVPGETPAGVMAEIQKVLTLAREEVPDLKADVSIARPDWNWEPIRKRGLNPALTAVDSAVVSLVRETHQQVLGKDPVLYFTDGYNELDFLVNDLGIPSIQYGPGDSRLAHTSEERVEVEELITCTEVYARLILKACGGEV
ncbi:Acetylornithine deacetylase [Neomoorella glycerini]|uniref:Acetylornithine deacetylase n=2 Tax=Neomoorella glycerini TaxID=55779 RepID=A0A6I5ZSQ0_9FIRM|nr:Acetylornithine deacetylase [Moorella glycerini]